MPSPATRCTPIKLELVQSRPGNSRVTLYSRPDPRDSDWLSLKVGETLERRILPNSNSPVQRPAKCNKSRQLRLTASCCVEAATGSRSDISAHDLVLGHLLSDPSDESLSQRNRNVNLARLEPRRDLAGAA